MRKNKDILRFAFLKETFWMLICSSKPKEVTISRQQTSPTPYGIRRIFIFQHLEQFKAVFLSFCVPSFNTLAKQNNIFTIIFVKGQLHDDIVDWVLECFFVRCVCVCEQKNRLQEINQAILIGPIQRGKKSMFIKYRKSLIKTQFLYISAC